MTDLRQAPSTPEPEPVVFYRCTGCGHAYEQIAPSSCDCMEGTGFQRVNYYTTPPRREWVDLTDEDEEQCRIDADASYRRHMSSIRGQMISPADNYDWHLIRAVLAKAKEKNT